LTRKKTSNQETQMDQQINIAGIMDV